MDYRERTTGYGTIADKITTQVEPQEKKKTPKGRAKKRITYTRRFVNVTLTGGKRKVRHQLYLLPGNLLLTFVSDEPQPNHIGHPRDVMEGFGALLFHD